MGTTLSRLFVRSSLDPSDIATSLLARAGYPVERPDGEHLVAREATVWRHGDWAVIESIVVTDLGLVAEPGDVVVSVECFDSDVAVLQRFVDGAEVGILIVGRDRPPGSGLVTRRTLPAFADRILSGEALLALERLTARSEHPAEQVCDDIVRLLGGTFLDEPTSPTVIVGYGARGAATGATLKFASWNDTIGAVGDDLAVITASFRKRGEPLRHARVEVGGPAIAQGLIEPTHVAYLAYAISRPEQLIADLHDRVATIDLRGFPTPETTVPLPWQDVSIEVHGRLSAPGAAVAQLTLTEINPGSERAVAEVDIDVSPSELTIARRGPLTHHSDERLLFGTGRIVLTLDRTDVDAPEWLESAFATWSTMLDLDSSSAIDVSYVEGVRSLRLSSIGAKSKRWERVRHALGTRDRFEASTPGYPRDAPHRFDFKVSHDQGEPRQRHVCLSVPETGDTTYERLRTLADAAAVAGIAWQITVTRCAADGSVPARLYNRTLGFHSAAPRRSELSELGRLVHIEPALADRLDQGVLGRNVDTSAVGGLVRLEWPDWPDIRLAEAVYEPILRRTPQSRSELSDH